MVRFEIGDKVRCIHPTKNILELNKIYTVESFQDTFAGKQKICLEETFHPTYVMSWRFEKVNEKSMKKTIKQAEYSDDIVRVDGQCSDLDYKFISIHPSDSSRVIYTYIMPGDNRGCVAIMKSSTFFDMFKLKPKERWVLVRDDLSPQSATRGPFHSMEEAIDYAEKNLRVTSNWEAVKLCNN